MGDPADDDVDAYIASIILEAKAASDAESVRRGEVYDRATAARKAALARGLTPAAADDCYHATWLAYYRQRQEESDAARREYLLKQAAADAVTYTKQGQDA